MKATIVAAKPAPNPTDYPCLKHHAKTGLIVLFQKDRTGVVVSVGDGSTSYDIGSAHHNYWAEFDFKPFVGTVTLEN